MKDFLGEEAKRTENEREENRQTIREGKGKSTLTQTKTANDGSQAKLEARELLLSERRAAEDAIQRQDIPAGYREYLRRYFDGIQPPEEPAAAPEGGTAPPEDQR